MTRLITTMLVIALMASLSACTPKKTAETQPEATEPQVEETAEQQELSKTETAPKESADGVDKDSYLRNPLNDQIVEINGKEYLYDAGIEIWMEYLGENEYESIDSSDVDMAP